jgi:hypothetical protein
MVVDTGFHHYTNMNFIFSQTKGGSLSFSAPGGRGKEETIEARRKNRRRREGAAEGGGGGNSAAPEPETKPRRPRA